jgi:hypothetical protein
MVSSISKGLPQNIEQLVTDAISQGVLRRRDHLKLTAAMLSSPNLSVTERTHINQMFDLIRSGRVRLMD